MQSIWSQVQISFRKDKGKLVSFLDVCYCGNGQGKITGCRVADMINHRDESTVGCELFSVGYACVFLSST